ncbi:glycoprotein 3-alpha-L-fucosyltransferase A-like [Lytechinus variegatus]|uniref:glycoprotein 3-alpha-L-fucosyltransferase A-like n=1 Tax=Lytechinus variegatus TaxID=7654 RepID=UPI001BB1A898|nr:glycoprotein 3-alpha-L-fucosyltransferase A-like [Lytechinus variegatus]
MKTTQKILVSCFLLIASHTFTCILVIQLRERRNDRLHDFTHTFVRNLSQSSPCYVRVHVWCEEGVQRSPQKFECPGLECGIIFSQDVNYDTMKSSDAVVHVSYWDWSRVLKERPPNQVLIFFTLESPKLTIHSMIPPRGYDRVYSYTMSYRPSSTIHSPYGFYDSTVPQLAIDDDRNWASGKTELVAWVSSKCNGKSPGGYRSWRRLEFVETLAKYVSVNMYGKCGNKECDDKEGGCWNFLKTHKFYLALENNECRDYITEKFWHNALLTDTVPIVYGPPREDYERVAPPNSFIHLQDFKSFQELADYIKLVDSDDKLYNSFFEWKKQGTVRYMGAHLIHQPEFMCKVVSKLLDSEKKSRYCNQGIGEMNPSINEFLSASCFVPTGFPHDF